MLLVAMPGAPSSVLVCTVHNLQAFHIRCTWQGPATGERNPGGPRRGTNARGGRDHESFNLIATVSTLVAMASTLLASASWRYSCVCKLLAGGWNLPTTARPPLRGFNHPWTCLIWEHNNSDSSRFGTTRSNNATRGSWHRY